jgi:hypothetical protein
MRKRLFRAFMVIGLGGLVAAALVIPASASLDDAALPSLTVTKEVVASDNALPVDGVFEVQVTCAKYDFNALLTFKADGSVNTAPEGWVGSGNSWTYSGAHPEAAPELDDSYSPSPLRHGQSCEIVEVASEATTNLAKAPEYQCSFTNTPYPDQIFNFDKIHDDVTPGCTSAPVNGPVMVQFGDPRDQSCPQDLGVGDKDVLCKQSAYVTVTNTVADEEAPPPVPIPKPANFTG